ncbi:MAG: (S)-benzoin forming benzil reductase [Chitinispirillaceae bacterium]
MNYAVVTGTSRGLGEALANEFLLRGTHLFCISRHKNESLVSRAEKMNVPLDYFTFDLNNPDQIEKLMVQITDRVDCAEVKNLYLINNAGVLDPIGPTERNKASEITLSFSVNIIAPIVLTSQFIKQTDAFNCERTVVNISSGAAKKPYYGWSTYCTSKAAMDMYTRVVALEQEKSENPVKMISIAPGVVETRMQEQIRNASAEDFRSVEKFRALKREGKLLKPEYVARTMVELINQNKLHSGGMYDIRDF